MKKAQGFSRQLLIDAIWQAFYKMNFSARSFDRVTKVARTIADLAAAAKIDEEHIAEAIQLRNSVLDT